MTLYLSAVTLGLAVAAVVAAWLMIRKDARLAAADTRPDVGLSIMERHDDRPDSIGTWRPARPGDTPGQVEPDDAPAQDPTAWATYCGLLAELATAERNCIEARRGPGRHRRYYTGEWPALQEPVTSWLEAVA